MRFEQLNPKNQKFLKMDVPIDRYSIVQLFPYFSLNNEIEKVLGTFFMRFEQLNPKNQKFLKMDVPIDRYSIVQLFPYFSLNNEIEKSVGNLFYAFRVAESKKPKIFKNGRSYRPLFNCIAFSLIFFKQRDREKCWEPFLCVSSS